MKVLVLCLGLGLLPTTHVSAGDMTDHSLEQVLIESATTPEQHAALANYYKAQATGARQQAAYHRQMGASYAAGKIVTLQAQKEHCAKLESLAESSAQEYDKLAEAHAALAKK
ncbi:MAG: hypothetical protein WEF50_21350 [Myxococcota bacterium]